MQRWQSNTAWLILSEPTIYVHLHYTANTSGKQYLTHTEKNLSAKKSFTDYVLPLWLLLEKEGWSIRSRSEWVGKNSRSSRVVFPLKSLLQKLETKYHPNQSFLFFAFFIISFYSSTEAFSVLCRVAFL